MGDFIDWFKKFCNVEASCAVWEVAIWSVICFGIGLGMGLLWGSSLSS